MEYVRLDDIKDLVRDIQPDHRNYYYLEENEQAIVDKVEEIIEKIESLEVVDLEEE